MKQQQPPLKNSNFQNDKRASRRSVLALAAGGLPMVLTLKASAQQAANSALNCAFRLPRRTRILVDDQGNAWENDRLNINYRADRGGFRIDQIERFKNDSRTVMFSGGVSQQYIPLGCSTPPSGNRQDCGYALYRTNRNINPADFISNGGFNNVSGANGLYVELSVQYANTVGSTGRPGISCIVSILNNF